MCDRFHCLPSALLAEDASLLRMLAIEKRGRPDDDQGGGQEYGELDGLSYDGMDEGW